MLIFLQVNEKKLGLRVAYLSGDDLYDRVGPNMPTTKEELQHLDSDNSSAAPASLTYAFLRGTADGKAIPMVSVHAYLGARGIVHGLRNGADIILCGRVADASPVIAAAWFWHDWAEADYDELAGALVAGHLIECSAYVTGGNFSGFDKYDLDDLVAPGFPIAEIEADGACVITKHSGTKGMVTVDTVRCQFLYELQGTVYLNSDVNAYIGNIAVEEVGKDRYTSLCSTSPKRSSNDVLTVSASPVLKALRHRQQLNWLSSIRVDMRPRSSLMLLATPRPRNGT